MFGRGVRLRSALRLVLIGDRNGVFNDLENRSRTLAKGDCDLGELDWVDPALTEFVLGNP